MPAWSWSLILGALGGLFHAVYRGGLVMPHKEKGADGIQRLDLGFLKDVLLGAGGGFVAWGIPLKVLLPLLNISVDDANQATAALARVIELLGGWSGGALLNKFALQVEKEKVAALKDHAQSQSTIPGVSDTIQALSNAKTRPEIALLRSQLPNLTKVAGGKQ